MLDAYTTKTAAVTSAATSYPTGAIASGGSAVDEVEWYKGAIAKPMVATVHVPQAAGTLPTLDVTIESDDNTSFSSAQTRVTMRQIIAAGVYETQVPAIPERYIRFKFVAAGTSPDFGTVTVGLRLGGRSDRWT